VNLTSWWFIAGQHRCYALGEIMNQIGKNFTARISSSFTVVVWDCMPKQVSHFVSKVWQWFVGVVLLTLLPKFILDSWYKFVDQKFV